MNENIDDWPTPLIVIWVFLHSFHLLISSIISLVGIGLAACWKDDKRCEAYFIMLYLRAAFWILTFVRIGTVPFSQTNQKAKILFFYFPSTQLFDRLIKHRHEQLRLNGYHDFHRSTAAHKGIPLFIVRTK